MKAADRSIAPAGSFFLQQIFMKHYYYIEVLGEEGSFDIYYLLNHNDKTEIASIEIPGLGPMSVYPSEHASYQYYKMRKATVKIDKYYLKEQLKSNRFEITDLLVQFNNGKQQQVNIGKINIQFEDKSKPQQLSVSSGSSSDNTGFDEFRTEKPVKITGLNY